MEQESLDTKPMDQDQFDQWFAQHAPSYRAAPSTDFDSLWTRIDDARNAPIPITRGRAAPRTSWVQPWMRMAAVLVVGVSVGRLSTQWTMGTSAARSTPSRTVAMTGTTDSLPAASLVAAAINVPETERYLGQTVALLSSLQSGVRTDGDSALTARAGRLLHTTRFLLDSPSAQSPNVRALLEDLELVLAQVVQMPPSRSSTDVELIHQALQQRDVMPRLRTAVANLNSAD
jgi:hypothetical protein